MLTASIVLYHTNESYVLTILNCINESCIDIVYIIDNSSDDYFCFLEEQYKKVRYIRNKNSGYGTSHNVALREAADEGSDFHIILNPDIRFSPDIISVLLSYMQEHDDVVYILPKVTYPDGTIQYLCKLLPTPFDLIVRRFIPNVKFVHKLNDRYILRNSGYNKIINPPCLSGCFMFLRMTTIMENNLFFDERFFMYCEDFDFIRRLHQIGKTIFYPNISIIHDHAKESFKSKKMMFEHIKSAIKYFNKWGWFYDNERKMMNKRILSEVSFLEDK